jgi:hypothetical protein
MLNATTCSGILGDVQRLHAAMECTVSQFLHVGRPCAAWSPATACRRPHFGNRSEKLAAFGLHPFRDRSPTR